MRKFYLFAAFILSSFFSIAQGTTGFSGTGANIDVKNYQIWWRIAPDSALGIKGVVNISFTTTDSNVTSISFDLRNVLVIDNVSWHGTSVTPIRTGNTFSIPVNIPEKGTWDSVTITYHGAPPLPSGQAAGFTISSDANAGKYVNTLSESYEDRDWWPCKADMQDKADTVDITVSVPWKSNNAVYANATDTFWVASNGTLVDSTIDVGGKSRTFKYINRYPIASYLVCLGVARYNRYYRGTIPIGGFNVPVVYYIMAGKSSTSAIAAMDKATEMLTVFSQKFGNYGFIDPARGGKHGFYEGLSSAGGMEHQTFTAIASGSITSKDIMIHELQHQWFGDKVSFSTWQDLWLAEGFAEYAPVLARENITGLSSTAYSYRSGLQSSAISESAPVRIPLSGIASSNTIWNGGTGSTGYGSSVYDRGAMVVSMLRTLAGDELFFKIMREYQTRPGLEFRSASTDTLKQLFNDYLGVDLTPFFTDNVVGTGYPTNTVGYQYYGADGKTLALTVSNQTRTNAGSSAYITQPIVVHVKGALASNDTTIVFYNWGGGVLSTAGKGVGPQTPGNLLTYSLSFVPTSIKYDDSLKTTSAGSMVLQNIIVSNSPPTVVKIINFTAQMHPGYNSTLLILNTSTRAVLERSSNGITYTALGTMILQPSTSTNQVNYALNDMSPLTRNNYYRAKVTQGDGTFIYSKVVKINSQPAPHFAIVTNPVQSRLQVNTQDAAGKSIIFGIYDMNQRPILKGSSKNAGSITNIDLPQLSPGLYMLQITTADKESQVIKFIVQ